MTTKNVCFVQKVKAKMVNLPKNSIKTREIDRVRQVLFLRDLLLCVEKECSKSVAGIR